MINIIEDIYYEEKTKYYYQKKWIGNNFYFNPIDHCHINWKLISIT